MRVHDLAERGLLPDALVRLGVRRQLRKRLREQAALPDAVREGWLAGLRATPVAAAALANPHHYDVSPRFFEALLGPRQKYSCCYWPRQSTTLTEAEEAMLALTCERAGLVDGMSVLDLGCGWGSLALFIAERFPHSRVMALSNSKLHRDAIRAGCQRQGMHRVEVFGADINDFAPDQGFDRVIAIEVFEQARNWERLLERIAGWLTPEGQLFTQFSCHRDYTYPYDDAGAGSWMAENFLGGGIMASESLIYEFPRHLQVERHWRVNGTHYQRTLEAWLARMDQHRERVDAGLRESYGDGPHAVWRQRWHLFFLACSELFGWQGGESWHVAHYRMRRADS
jgi:cyclopropane-fatty-acyl-phospholipid synthase